jgi:hypothetical protein
MVMKFEMWEVRRLFRVGSLKTVASELAKCKLNLVAVHELLVSQEGLLHGVG